MASLPTPATPNQKLPQLRISPHAHLRITELSTLTLEQVWNYLNRFSIPIANDGANRVRHLFYSVEDETWFIAVQAKDKTLVTVMPYDYKAREISGEALEMARRLVVTPIAILSNKAPEPLPTYPGKIPAQDCYLAFLTGHKRRPTPLGAWGIKNDPISGDNGYPHHLFVYWLQRMLWANDINPEHATAKLYVQRQSTVTFLGPVREFAHYLGYKRVASLAHIFIVDPNRNPQFLGHYCIDPTWDPQTLLAKDAEFPTWVAYRLALLQLDPAEAKFRIRVGQSSHEDEIEVSADKLFAAPHH